MSLCLYEINSKPSIRNKLNIFLIFILTQVQDKWQIWVICDCFTLHFPLRLSFSLFLGKCISPWESGSNIYYTYSERYTIHTVPKLSLGKLNTTLFVYHTFIKMVIQGALDWEEVLFPASKWAEPNSQS